MESAVSFAPLRPAYFVNFAGRARPTFRGAGRGSLFFCGAGRGLHPWFSANPAPRMFGEHVLW